MCTRTIHPSCSNEIRRVVSFEDSDIIACSASCVNINECPQLKEKAVAFVKSKGKTTKKELKKRSKRKKGGGDIERQGLGQKGHFAWNLG